MNGQQFGRLTVLAKAKSISRGKYWLCRCVCGNQKVIRGSHLKYGTTKSCGCLSIETTRARNLKEPYRYLHVYLRRNARHRSINCPLTFEEFLSFVPITRCHYCRTKIEWEPHCQKGSSTAYHLDRKNNNVGYTHDNCVVCCGMCNRIKNAFFTYDEMLKIGRLLHKIYGERSRITRMATR